MQPTEIQVERSLQALQTEPETGVAGASGPDAPDLPAGLVELLATAPAVRLDRVVDARMRMEAEDQPSAEDLARRVVGRMVCDRLR